MSQRSDFQMMAPMPAGGDDLPQSDDGLGTSPPPTLTVTSSDEEDEEAPADAGYQPLPLGEPDDDVTGESETEVENAAEAVSTSVEEAFGRSATSNIVLQSTHLPPASLAANVDVKERAELWSKVHSSRTDTLPMDPDHAETIRSVMSNVSLPESCFPAWANFIPEAEWKAKLVSQISGSTDVISDNVVGSSSVEDCSNADNSSRSDVYDAL